VVKKKKMLTACVSSFSFVGFAFVTMGSQADAMQAIQALNGYQFGDKTMAVLFSTGSGPYGGGRRH
jgi:RNA recognition motif-containing protein